MKKILLIAALCLTPFTVQAEEGVIKLPGNAEYRPGGGSGTVIVESYDTNDVIYRRLVNPRYGRDNYNRRVPNNDAANICGGIERDRKRERCLDDYREERQKLIEKYN